MRTYYKQIIVLFLLGQSFAQKDIYRNVDAIEKEWDTVVDNGFDITLLIAGADPFNPE